MLIAVSDFLSPGEELEMEYEDKGRGTWLCRIKYGKFTAIELVDHYDHGVVCLYICKGVVVRSPTYSAASM